MANCSPDLALNRIFEAALAEGRSLVLSTEERRMAVADSALGGTCRAHRRSTVPKTIPDNTTLETRRAREETVATVLAVFVFLRPRRLRIVSK